MTISTSPTAAGLTLTQFDNEGPGSGEVADIDNPDAKVDI